MDKATFNLSELTDVLKRTDKVPFGFFVSQAIWDGFASRFLKESGDPLASIQSAFNRTPMVVDPRLADTQFDVAFSEDVWRARLRELNLPVPKGRTG